MLLPFEYPIVLLACCSSSHANYLATVGSFLLRYGTPTIITHLHKSPAKSMPSESFPRNTANTNVFLRFSFTKYVKSFNKSVSTLLY